MIAEEIFLSAKRVSSGTIAIEVDPVKLKQWAFPYMSVGMTMVGEFIARPVNSFGAIFEQNEAAFINSLADIASLIELHARPGYPNCFFINSYVEYKVEYINFFVVSVISQFNEPPYMTSLDVDRSFD